ncbi:AbiV family abortive infection protein [Pseudooceanicola algae]|nr:AbiV family abortive infection protein [Pseudooceanicola algae]
MDKAKASALEGVVANVKRLLRDARILQENGSAGSALSLSILAFEEAGKGHIIENGWRKPKHVHSQHRFRHLMAFIVLQASLQQKYELDMKGVSDKIAARFTALGHQPGMKEPLPPMSLELREELRAELLPQLSGMSDDQIKILGIEQRWLSKIFEAVHEGNLEKIRQSGLYLDTNSQLEVTSTPDSVGRLDAERWIWAATRVLNLLEKGLYSQSYSPLSELLTAANAGDQTATRVLDEVTSEHREAKDN